MKSNTFFKLTFLTPLLFSGFLSNSAYANTITFEQPIFDNATDTITLGISMDFTDGTLGGGIDLNFDNANLTFKSFTSGGYDTFGTVNGGTIENISIAPDATNDGLTPITGHKMVETLVFKVGHSGTYNFSLAENTSLSSGFYSGVGNEQLVSYGKTSITVDHISAVPEPSELLLMLSGLAIMSATVKAKKSKNLA